MTGIAPDTDRLNEFLGRFVGDLAATAAAGNVVVGHRLGLYAALAHGPATGADLADRTGCAARPVIESVTRPGRWRLVEYDPATERYSMTVEQAFCRADPDGALYLPGAFLLALGALRAAPGARLLGQVEAEAQAGGVDPPITDLGQAPYRRGLRQGVCELSQAGGVGEAGEAVALLDEPDPAARAAAATYSWPLRMTCAPNGGCPDILIVMCPHSGSRMWKE